MRIHYQCRLSLSRERLLSYTVTTTDVPVEFSQSDCFWILLFESSAHFGRLLFSESQRTFVLFFHAFQYLHGILLPLFRPRQYAVKHIFYFLACHSASISHSAFGRYNARMHPDANDPDRRVTYFGATHTRGKREIFGIRGDDRGKHIYVIGKTGMGKSTMLENMAIQDIQNGEGIAFIDPHGATAERLLDFVPY